jgi:sodium-coupled neutral amino acid transporter 11
MIAFSIILGDTIPHVLQAIIPTSNPVIDFFTGRTFIVIVLTMGVSYPLSLYREIEKLSKASALALISYVPPPIDLALAP